MNSIEARYHTFTCEDGGICKITHFVLKWKFTVILTPRKVKFMHLLKYFLIPIVPDACIKICDENFSVYSEAAIDWSSLSPVFDCMLYSLAGDNLPS